MPTVRTVGVFFGARPTARSPGEGVSNEVVDIVARGYEGEIQLGEVIEPASTPAPPRSRWVGRAGVADVRRASVPCLPPETIGRHARDDRASRAAAHDGPRRFFPILLSSRAIRLPPSEGVPRSAKCSGSNAC